MKEPQSSEEESCIIDNVHAAAAAISNDNGYKSVHGGKRMKKKNKKFISARS
jgi:hypothetical protein